MPPNIRDELDLDLEFFETGTHRRNFIIRLNIPRRQPESATELARTRERLRLNDEQVSFLRLVWHEWTLIDIIMEFVHEFRTHPMRSMPLRLIIQLLPKVYEDAVMRIPSAADDDNIMQYAWFPALSRHLMISAVRQLAPRERRMVGIQRESEPGGRLSIEGSMMVIFDPFIVASNITNPDDWRSVNTAFSNNTDESID
ncbi:MAG: hypothetical protein M1834_006023 [Cirrosporium novae-zelandiae]|nr:MAG: hypothetical protein M1834_006023 [Cirrosporium novae-zelandiae]